MSIDEKVEVQKPNPSRFRKYITLPLAGLAALVGFAVSNPKADAGIIDGTNYVQTTNNVEQWIADPANGTFGHVTGLCQFDNGTEFGVLYDSGNVSFWNDAPTISNTPIKTISTGGSTGIAEFDPAKYPGQICVTDDGEILFYDMNGNYKGNKQTPLSSIRDVAYDAKRDRILLSCQLGTDILNPNGSVTFYSPANAYGIHVANLTNDGNGNTINDLFEDDKYFSNIAQDGSLYGTTSITDLGSGSVIQGIAYTQDHLIVDEQLPSGPDYIVVYGTQPFQNYMNYSVSVPEPSILALGAAGLIMLGGTRAVGRRLQKQDTKPENKTK